MEKASVALVGFGTVGTGVAKILLNKKKELAERTGFLIELKYVVDSDLARDRGIRLPRGLLTNDLEAVLRDPDVKVAAELVGGTTAARTIQLRLLEAGKDVVTANKALLATYGSELFQAAARAGRVLAFEASVCGGIPIIGALREGFVANRILSFSGIVNGTANYILTRMDHQGLSYREALLQAQQKGYAEKDPSLDVDGIDSAHKLAILARCAFGVDFDAKEIYTEGIRRIDLRDIQYAGELGYAIKLLAIGKNGPSEIELRVHPTLIPRENPLGVVDEAYNAVSLRGDAVGRCLLYGRGAGMMPTASAVVADIVDVLSGRARRSFRRLKAFWGDAPRRKVRRIEEIRGKYYFRFMVLDRPGVLGRISTILGKHRISILSVIQKEIRKSGSVPLVVMTHEALEKDVQAALKEIDRLKVVKAKSISIRVEAG